MEKTLFAGQNRRRTGQGQNRDKSRSLGFRTSILCRLGEDFSQGGLVKTPAFEGVRAATCRELRHIPLGVFALLLSAGRAGIVSHNQSDLAHPGIAFKF